MRYAPLLLLSLTACGVGNITLSTAPISPAGSTLSADQPTGVVVGSVGATVTIRVLSGSGQPVRDQEVLVTVSGSDNTVSTPQPTDADGRTRVLLTSTRAEVKTLRAAILSHGKRVELPKALDVEFVAGAPAGLVFLEQPVDAESNTALGAAVHVQVVDVYGNYTQANGVVVSLSVADNPNAGIRGDLTQSSVKGVATFTSAQIDRAGIMSLQATATGLAPGTSLPFTIREGAPVQLGFGPLPTQCVAGAALTPALVVQVQDSGGNWVKTAAGGLVTLALASGPAGATLGGTVQAYATGGQATFSNLTIDKAGAVTLRATATAYGAGVSPSFTVLSAAPVAANSSLTASPAQVVADGNVITAVTFTVRDAHNNGVPGVSVQLQGADTADLFTPSSGSTDAQGRFVSGLTARLTGTRQLTGSFGTQQVRTAFTFIPGAPSGLTSTLTASPTTLVAGGGSSSLTLRVLDAAGNPISGRSISLSSTGTYNTLTPLGGSTDASGLFTATLTSTKAEDKVISANVPTQAPAVVNVGPAALNPANSTLVGLPAKVAADGITSMQIVFTAQDGYHNGVPGQSVSLVATGTGNVFDPNAGVTTGDGTVRGLLTSTKAESKHITATMNGSTYSTDVLFVPGPASAATSSLTASPNPLPSDGVTTTTLSVTAQDAQHNPITGTPVLFASSGGNNVFSSVNPNTNASGQVSVTLASRRAETKHVTATVAGLTLPLDVVFNPGPPVSSHSSLVAYPASHALADGRTVVTVVLRLHDLLDNPIGGASISLASPSPSDHLARASGSTSAAGTFVTQLTSTQPGTRTLTASYGSSQTSTASVTFVGSPVCAGTPRLPGAPWPTLDGNDMALVAGDFNEDGAIDLVVAERDQNQLAMYLQHARGVFAQPTYVAVGGAPRTLAAARLDADGHLDLAVGHGDATLGVLLGVGDGTFGTLASSSLPGVPDSLLATQVGGSAALDLVAVVHDTNSLVALIGDGTGGFGSVHTTATGLGPHSVAMGDFNLDGVPDAVVSVFGDDVQADGMVLFLAGHNDGTFTAHSASAVAVAPLPGPITVADFNHDGSPDWVALSRASQNPTLTVALGKGDGDRFTVRTLVNDPVLYAGGLVAADLNGDSHTDLVSSSDIMARAQVRLGAGDGNFATPVDVVTAFGTVGVPNEHTLGTLAQDLDGDAVPDIAVINNESRSLGVLHGVGDGNFVTPLSRPAGMGARAIRLADVNEDGKLDALAVAEDSNVSVLLGQDTGAFAAPALVAQAGSTLRDLDWGDVDGDGHLDLAVASAGDGHVVILNGSGDGNFRVGAALPAGDTPGAVRLVDMNNDGSPDVVVVQQGNTLAQVALNDGTGGFGAPVTALVGLDPGALAVGPVDGDGFADVVVANNGNDTVSVLLGVGDGTLQTKIDLAVARPSAVLLGDFDEDGVADLWVASADTDTVSFFTGQGNGHFAAATDLTLASSPVDVQAADLNGDGHLDAVVVLRLSSAVAVLLGRGDGTFAPALRYPFDSITPFGCALGDVNGDGGVDVLVPQSETHTLGVLLGGQCEP